MEHAIGEIITLQDGRKAEVVESKHENVRCVGCVFFTPFFGCRTFDAHFPFAYCIGTKRTDHKNIIYKEVKV